MHPCVLYNVSFVLQSVAVSPRVGEMSLGRRCVQGKQNDAIQCKTIAYDKLTTLQQLGCLRNDLAYKLITYCRNEICLWFSLICRSLWYYHSCVYIHNGAHNVLPYGMSLMVWEVYVQCVQASFYVAYFPSALLTSCLSSVSVASGQSENGATSPTRGQRKRKVILIHSFLFYKCVRDFSLLGIVLHIMGTTTYLYVYMYVGLFCVVGLVLVWVYIPLQHQLTINI